MMVFRFAIAAFLMNFGLNAWAGEAEDQVVKDLGPLIGRVRGPVRQAIEQGKGCLPWASLKSEADGKQDIVDFGFTPEMAKSLWIAACAQSLC